MTEIEVRVRHNGKPYLRVRLKESPATIGRDPEADVHLDSTAVSRVHARLFFDGHSVSIVDADSTNGIKIDGVQYARADIDPTQTVTICDFAIRARRVLSPAELGNELSAGWLDSDDEESDDDTSSGKEADTHVGERESSMPSVSLRLEDVVPEPSYAPLPDTDVEGTAGLDEERPDTSQDVHAEHSGDVENWDTAAIADDDDEADDLDAERIPTDVPAIISVMRNAASEIETARLTRQGVAVEVLVCVGARLHDVALVRTGEQYWWGEEPQFPTTLWTVPAVDRFPLVTHREPGIYDVQVPQDSTWKMFHRGDHKAPTFRSGQLVGMRVRAREAAEVTYGPYTIYIRCVNTPPPLVKRLDFRRFIPTPVAVMAVLASALINVAVVAMPGKRPNFFTSPIPDEHFVVHEVGFKRDTPPDIPVPELQLELPPELAQADKLVNAPEDVKQGVADEPVTDDAPALPVKPQKKVKRDATASVTTIEAVKTPKQVSIGDFRVAGLMQGVPEPMIERGKAPPISGGTALLRGERPGQTMTSVIDKSGATGNFAIIPPGRLDASDVKLAVNRYGSDLKRCQGTNPEAYGRLDMQWIVDESGSVKSVRVVLDELRSPDMTKCVREAVSHWKFPQPKGGAAVVSFPFRFANPNLGG